MESNNNRLIKRLEISLVGLIVGTTMLMGSLVLTGNHKYLPIGYLTSTAIIPLHKKIQRLDNKLYK